MGNLSCNLLRETCVDFFHNRVIQKNSCKVTTISIGIIFFVIGAIAITGIVLPNAFPHTFFSTATYTRKLVLAVSSMVAGVLVTGVGGTAICVKRKEKKKLDAVAARVKNAPKRESVVISDDFLSKKVSKSNSLESEKTIFTPLSEKSTTWAKTQGRRPHMEDTHVNKFFQVNDKDVLLTGVFDGHGDFGSGVVSAEFLEKNIQTYLKEELEKLPSFSIKAVTKAIKAACERMDKALEVSQKENDYGGGTCGAMVLIAEGNLYAINIGDSRIVQSSKKKATPLSKDAKPSDPEIEKQVKARGGNITSAITTSGKVVYRVNNALGVAKSFGDYYIRNPKNGEKVISAEPEIRVVPLSTFKPGDFIIIACDGLWDVYENQEAVDAVSQYSDKETASQMLVNTAYNKGSDDNITVGILRF